MEVSSFSDILINLILPTSCRYRNDSSYRGQLAHILAVIPGILTNGTEVSFWSDNEPLAT